MRACYLSDEQLVQRCRDTWWERAVFGRIGCGFGILLSTRIAIAVGALVAMMREPMIPNDPWWLLILEFALVGLAGLLALPFAGLAVMLILFALGQWRSAPYVREAQRRWMPYRASNTVEALREPPIPDDHVDWTVALTGFGAPRGPSYSLCLWHSDQANGCVCYNARVCRGLDLGKEDPRPHAQSASGLLSDEDVDIIESLIHEAATGKLTSQPWEVRDGGPCQLILITRQNPKPQHVSTNLCNTRHSDALVMRLAHALADLRQRLLPWDDDTDGLRNPNAAEGS